jgi:hypothetical protein
MSKATVRDVKCARETDKAIFVTDGAGWEMWIPKSQVHDDSEVYARGHEGDLVIKGWFAEKEGLGLD